MRKLPMPRLARLLLRAATFRSFVSCCSCSSFPQPDDLLSADSGKLLRATRGIDTKSVVPRHCGGLYGRVFSPLTVSTAIRRAPETVSRPSRARVVSPPRCAVRRRHPSLISTGSRLECEALHAMPRSPAGQLRESGNIASACDSLNGSRNMSRRRWRPRKTQRLRSSQPRRIPGGQRC